MDNSEKIKRRRETVNFILETAKYSADAEYIVEVDEAEASFCRQRIKEFTLATNTLIESARDDTELLNMLGMFIAGAGIVDKIDRLPKATFEHYQKKGGIRAIAGTGGKNKKGHEGILKRAIRDVIESGAKDFDTMLAALDFQVLIAEIDDNKVTYIKPDETLKTVSMDAVKKAYREIIENS